MKFHRKVAAAVLAAVLISGCAPAGPLIVAPEKDQAIVACKDEGCVAIPTSLWDEIVRVLIEVGVIQQGARI